MNRTRAHFQAKRIWITGASSGIGRALAIELARYGAQLMLTARDEAALEEVASLCDACARVLVAPADVGVKEENQRVAAMIQQQFGGLDIAILNAGTAEYVDVSRFDSAVFERLIRINFLGMVYGIEAALPLLRQSPAPQLVGMSSTAAYGGLPRSEAYGASKAAVRNMLAALRISLAPAGISVSTICPGFVRTALTDKNDFPMPLLLNADDAAGRIAKGVARYREEIHFPKRFSLVLKLMTSLPSSWYTALIKAMVLRK